MFRRIFVLGPSHHFYTERMNLSGVDLVETPFGDLSVDTAIRQELLSTGLYDLMNASDDIDEHSLEMQVC